MKMLCAYIKVNDKVIDASGIHLKNDSETMFKTSDMKNFIGYLEETGVIQIIPNKDFTNLKLKFEDVIEITDTAGIVRAFKIRKVLPFNCFEYWLEFNSNIYVLIL